MITCFRMECFYVLICINNHILSCLICMLPPVDEQEGIGTKYGEVVIIRYKNIDRMNCRTMLTSVEENGLDVFFSI